MVSCLDFRLGFVSQAGILGKTGGGCVVYLVHGILHLVLDLLGDLTGLGGLDSGAKHTGMLSSATISNKEITFLIVYLFFFFRIITVAVMAAAKQTRATSRILIQELLSFSALLPGAGKVSAGVVAGSFVRSPIT